MLERNILMQDQALRQKVIQYVLERKCLCGGFCFYKLEEPNGSDTWFALSILNLLHYDFQDEPTVKYLKEMQRPDGTYYSIYTAYYSIKSLSLLGEIPDIDPRIYLAKNLGQYRFDARQLPAEVISLFRRTSYLVDLYETTGIDEENNIQEHIIEFILNFQNEDGGFGHYRSTLHETASALSMMDRFGYAIQELETESFIRRCEVPFFGFTDIPHTSLSFLEYVHAGVYASYLLRLKLAYSDQCELYIRSCQNRNGGFSRTMQSGIATLENTYNAIHALILLSTLTAAVPGI